jgi:glucokinase
MDIGGTHTRCRTIEYSDPALTIPQAIQSRSQRIATRDGLFAFIAELLSSDGLGGRLSSAVLCFAGPVTDHARVNMTNWTGNREIVLRELIACGLPAGNTLLVNDLEAAAYGLLQFGPGCEELIPLHTPVTSAAGPAHAVLLMPGTGTGLAAVLAVPDGAELPLVLPCETQHTPIPALDSYHAALIEEMRIMGKHTRPTWEDFVSGRGLEAIYQALARLDRSDSTRVSPDSIHDAGRIAELAVSGEDELCHNALATFYRCAGALAQVLALTIRPYGGIYLAGNSTRNNISYIPDSPFVTALHDNDRYRNMLETFPVYMVQADLNLDGAGFLARRSPNQAPQISLLA